MCPILSAYFSSPNDQPGHVFSLILVLLLLYLHNWIGNTSSIIHTECVQVVQLGKQKEIMKKPLEQQQEEARKQQQEFQNTLMAQMKTLFAEQNKQWNPPPPPRRVTIAQTSLDVKQVTDAIVASDMDAYLNAIGNKIFISRI